MSASADRRPIICCAIDDIALASLMRQPEAAPTCCNLCDEIIDGDVAGTGLFMWTRGDDVRFEEPPLCADCASTITVSAYTRWAREEEELD